MSSGCVLRKVNQLFTECPDKVLEETLFNNCTQRCIERCKGTKNESNCEKLCPDFCKTKSKEGYVDTPWDCLDKLTNNDYNYCKCIIGKTNCDKIPKDKLDGKTPLCCWGATCCS
jgi:hypothetical protein